MQSTLMTTSGDKLSIARQRVEDKLSIARQRVENARVTLGRQRALVADKKARGIDSEASEQLLATWERTLEAFESDLAALIKKSQSYRAYRGRRDHPALNLV